jgi:hypothetical protein
MESAFLSWSFALKGTRTSHGKRSTGLRVEPYVKEEVKESPAPLELGDMIIKAYSLSPSAL